MNREIELWRFAAERLKRNESAVLLVVAESAGSSPGRQGFKMIVAADEIAGSVGGGVMEMRLVEQAKSKVDSEIVEQVHQRNSPSASGMICSGKQTVVFYQLNSHDLPTVRRVVRALKTFESAILQITSDNFRVLETGADEFNFRFERAGETDFTFEEKLGFKNKLSIVGGGHCALALSELAAKMDFFIELYDDRPQLNTLAKNKFVHRKQIVASYDDIGDFIGAGASNHFVVVMTLGYTTDEIVIKKLLDKDFKYFGVLGSRAKIKALFQSLEKEGFDRERLNRIRAPVGVPINSRTPEEIAVSVAAEIIAVKNSQQGKSKFVSRRQIDNRRI